MTLSTFSGLSNPTSSPSPSGVANNYLEPTVDPQPPEMDRLLAKPYVLDTFHIQSVVNEREFIGLQRQMATLLSGFTISVPYYHKLTDPTRRTDNVSTGDVDDITVSYRRINGFQLKLMAPFQGNFDVDDPSQHINTTGVVYPGFQPHIDDFFLYAVAADKVARIEVTSINPMSWRGETAYQVGLYLAAYVDQAWIEEVELSVAERVFFSPQAYLAGTSTLLKLDEQVLLTDTNTMIEQLGHMFVRDFFAAYTSKTFMRPDNVYDPYIVEFLLRVIPASLTRVRPQQLMERPASFDRSFWYALMNREQYVPSRVYSYAELYQNTATIISTTFNSMLNGTYVQLVESTETGEAYISDGLLPEAEDPSDFDVAMRLWFESGLVDPTATLTLAQSVLLIEDDLTRFYQSAAVLGLLHLVRRFVLNGTLRTVSASIDDYIPTRFEFTQDDLSEARYLTLSMYNTVLGAIDNDGAVRYFADGEVVYNGQVIVIDMAGIMDRLEIDELTGTWQIMLTGIRTAP